jgi:hypothetical protein
MKKHKCGETFDGSVCALRKGHHGRHVDGTGGNGPLSWTEEGKQRVLAERSKEQEAKKQ